MRGFELERWYETKGKEFAKNTGYEVEAVVLASQGSEAKYLAAFMGRSGAPDFFFNGMTHRWCGQYDFGGKRPDDLAKIWDENLPAYMVPSSKWQGARYGVPIDNRNFQQMYINVDMFKRPGPHPDRPPKTFSLSGTRP